MKNQIEQFQTTVSLRKFKRLVILSGYIAMSLLTLNAHSAACSGPVITVGLSESCNYIYNNVVTSSSDLYLTKTEAITSITNAGALGSGGFGIYNNVVTSPDSFIVHIVASIGAIANTGTIGNGAYGIYNNAVSGPNGYLSTLTASIESISNSGSIIGTSYGIYNNAVPGPAGIGTTLTASIGTITNTGTIGNGTYGIYNNGSIATLNNLQGASSSALKFSRNLPTNYNIIINSPSDYGKIAFTSVANSTTFGIYSTSILAASTTYSSVISGLSAGNFLGGTSGTFTSGSKSYSWLLSNSSGSIWDLMVGLCTGCGPSKEDSQASIHNSAQRLRSTFNASAISTNFANMNTYDCNLFDTKGMCISAGGRYTTVDNPNSNSTSAVVVVGYKATPNIRIGGFLDQNVSNNTPNGIKVSNKNPLMGIFAVWNQNADGLGIQVKLANAYQDKDVSTTRDVIGTSEAGTGNTNLNTQSYVGELSYAFLTNQDKTTLRPYLALRQTTIKQDAYTETGVANPLSYGSLKDRSTTALVGLKLNHALTPKATLTASLGLEQDLEHSVDQYSATSSSISGLTSENFNDSIKRTRPVASAGAYYAVSKTQRISGDVYYQQLPFQSTGSTTAYFSYMIGL